MSDPYFFGYGSLVNRATHGYAQAHRARVQGWRRAWRYTRFRAGPFLTAVPCPVSEIEGLVARVPGADWRALDEREIGYDRLPTGSQLTLAGPATQPAPALDDTQIYAVPDAHAVPADASKEPILLSYVDVVFQGYLREFGIEGVMRFIATTDGWDTPVLNDRAAPRYPRHQALSTEEREQFDAVLRDLGVDLRRI
ncbi:MAG: gamma-glutamylcyclotransferase family protein [Pararhodobacter sp.]